MLGMSIRVNDAPLSCLLRGVGSHFVNKVIRKKEENMSFLHKSTLPTIHELEKEFKLAKTDRSTAASRLWKYAANLALHRGRSKSYYQTHLKISSTEHMSSVDAYDGENARKGRECRKVSTEPDDDLLLVHPHIDGRLVNVGKDSEQTKWFSGRIGDVVVDYIEQWIEPIIHIHIERWYMVESWRRYWWDLDFGGRIPRDCSSVMCQNASCTTQSSASENDWLISEKKKSAWASTESSQGYIRLTTLARFHRMAGVVTAANTQPIVEWSLRRTLSTCWMRELDTRCGTGQRVTTHIIRRFYSPSPDRFLTRIRVSDVRSASKHGCT